MNRESPITTPREIPVSDLVPHWLSEVNLSYAIPNFEMAGITTPRSFAELPLSYYEPLGVTKAEDRKNLFYLIQHVKKEIVSGEIAIREEKERKLLEEGNVNNSVGGARDGEIKVNDDAEYKQDEFHSPSNSKSRVNDYINGVVGDSSKSIATTNNDADMMSTVHYNNQEPISPVTISSPIASVVGEDFGRQQRGVGRGAVKKKLALGGVKEVGTLNTGIITSSNKEESASTVKLTPREQLEKELEQRRLKRQQQKMAEKKQDNTASINYKEEKKEKKSKRRQSFLPSVGGGGSVSSSRRSSIASSYRPSVVNKKNGDEFDELGSLLDDSEEKKCSSDLEDDYTASKSTATPRTVASVDVRSMRRSSIHHRQTIKKTNATKVGGGSRTKNRRYSSIPRATVPLLNDDDDDGSILSDTSDLSASVASYRSLGSSARSSSRRSSLASASTIGTAHSSARSGLSGLSSGFSKNGVDENQINGKFDTSSRRMSLSKSSSRPGSGATVSSIASNRTGKKRLSTIPSSSIAPLSPLVKLSSSQLDQSMASQSIKLGIAGGGSCNPSRRRSSMGSGRAVSSRPGTVDSVGSKKVKAVNNNVGSPNSTSRSITKKKLNVSSSRSKTNTSGDSSVKQRQPRVKSPVPLNNNNRSRSKSPTRPISRARSKSPFSTRGGGMSPRRRNMSPPPQRNRAVSPMRTNRPPTSPKSLGVVGNRPLSPIRSPTRGRATTPKSPRRVKSPVSGSGDGNSAIFVHGVAEDKSWATQIGRLRESFDNEHAEHMTTRGPAEEDDEYEMRIRVLVRKRPMSKKEAADGSEVDVIHPLDYNDYGRILVHQPKTKLDLTKEVETTSFAFDNTFDEHSNNVQIYERAVQGLIPGLFRGKWASVFAYGQTGSGKTFTMMGANATGMRAGNQAENSTSDTNLGLYCLAAQDVFKLAEDPANADISIGVSLFEIYGGKLLDLLNERNPVKCLEDRKGKVCFPGLSEHPVNNANELMDIIDAGALNRSTGTTSANADSSRSHAVLQLSLRKDVGRTKNKEFSRLTFIDLAGSERGADTSKACRTTRMEGAEINTSLLALKEVIRALAVGSSLKRIPFRGSKLTQVLKESFVGKNSRTIMVSCVAPNMKNCDHTLNTLRYADRVKERDPQTGQLSASVEASSRIKRDDGDCITRVKLPPRPLTAPATSFRIDTEEDYESSEDDIPPPPSMEDNPRHSLDNKDPNISTAYSDDFHVDQVVDSDENDDSLEKALNSNGPKQPTASPLHQPIPQRPQTLKGDPEAQSLIATHKSIMSKLLQMLQHEMTLVNDTDSNRDNIDEYLKELEELSDEQLSLLSTLRDSLTSFNTSRTNETAAQAVDDSFDYRD